MPTFSYRMSQISTFISALAVYNRFKNLYWDQREEEKHKKIELTYLELNYIYIDEPK